MEDIKVVIESFQPWPFWATEADFFLNIIFSSICHPHYRLRLTLILVTLVFLQLIANDRNSGYDNALNIAEDMRPNFPNFVRKVVIDAYFLTDIILKSRKLTLSSRAKG